jgi:hypothetical protein
MMRTAILAVMSFAFVVACATRLAPQPLHYTIDSGVLHFEHNGAMYIVTDAVTIARVAQIDADLQRTNRELKQETEPRSSSADIYNSNMKAGRSMYGIPPAASDTTQADASARPGYDPLQNASDRASNQTQVRRLKDDATRAQRKMRQLFDDAVIAGIAQRVG